MSTTIDDTLLDMDMSTVEDLPGFELPPEGSYVCQLSITPKTINGKANLEWKYTVVDAIELNDPDAEVPAKATFSTLTGLSPDKLPYIKVKATILAEGLGIANTPRALVDNVQNVQVNCVLKHRASDGKVYASIPDTGFALA